MILDQLTDQITALALPTVRKIKPLTIDEFVKIEFQKREPLMMPILNRGDLAMAYGPRGGGKTHLLTALSMHAAAGGALGPWKSTGKHGVLYLDGELMGKTMLERIALHAPETDDFDPSKFKVFTPELLADGEALPDLSTIEGQAMVDRAITPDDAIIVVDNLSSWCRSGRENEGESWLCTLEWLLSLRRRGHCVVLVHHSGKGGDQRGTSRREDHLDLVLKLTLPTDHDPEQGCRFNIEFTKARHLQGLDAQSLSVTMTVVGGSAKWHFEPLKDSVFQRVVTLINEGVAQSDIARELDINRSTVSRHAKKAQAQGLVAQTKAAR